MLYDLEIGTWPGVEIIKFNLWFRSPKWDLQAVVWVNHSSCWRLFKQCVTQLQLYYYTIQLNHTTLRRDLPLGGVFIMAGYDSIRTSTMWPSLYTIVQHVHDPFWILFGIYHQRAPGARANSPFSTAPSMSFHAAGPSLSFDTLTATPPVIQSYFIFEIYVIFFKLLCCPLSDILLSTFTYIIQITTRTLLSLIRIFWTFLWSLLKSALQDLNFKNKKRKTVFDMGCPGNKNLIYCPFCLLKAVGSDWLKSGLGKFRKWKLWRIWENSKLTGQKIMK